MLSSLRERMRAVHRDGEFQTLSFCSDCGVPFLASTLDQGTFLFLTGTLTSRKTPTEVNFWGHAKYLYETLREQRVRYCKMLLYCYPYYVVSYRFFKKKNVKIFHTMCVVSIALHFLQKPPYVEKKPYTHPANDRKGLFAGFLEH